MREVWLAVAMAGVLSACGDDSPPAVDGGVARVDGGMGTDGGMTPADSGPDAAAPADSGMPADGGGEITLTNEPAACAMVGLTSADPANGGHYAAARLTPPRFPFTVTSVSYTVMQDTGTCDSDQAHDVRVFTSTGTMPPGTPGGETISVPAPATPTATGTGRRIDLVLGTPVVVNAGEELFVAVQMVRTATPLCLEECLDPGEAERNWWSAAAAPPFPWRTLASYGNMGTLTISATGD